MRWSRPYNECANKFCPLCCCRPRQAGWASRHQVAGAEEKDYSDAHRKSLGRQILLHQLVRTFSILLKLQHIENVAALLYKNLNNFPWKFCSGVWDIKKLASVFLSMCEKWSVAIDFICFCAEIVFCGFAMGLPEPSSLSPSHTFHFLHSVFGRNQNTCPSASASMWFRYRGNNPSASTIAKP